MTDILGPANGTAVTTRKTEGRTFPTADTWFKPCTTPASQDGTQIQADWLNGIMAQLRAAIRGNGKLVDGVTPVVPEDNANDGMLLGAILQVIQRGQANFVVDTGTADAIVVAPSPALVEYKAGLRLSILKNPLVNANATTVPKINAGLGQVTIVKNDGSPLGAGDLKKGGIFEVEFDGTYARLTAPMVPSDLVSNVYVRPRAQGNVVVYVSPSGSDTANTGLSAASPFLTPQRAWTYLTSIDANGYSVTIQLANGTYAGAGLLAIGGLTGAQGGFCTILGNTGSPGSVIISNTQAAGLASANGGAISAVSGAQLSLSGFTVTSTNYNGVVANGPGSIIAMQNMVFGACPNGNHILSQLGAEIYTNAGTYQITGNAQAHFATAQSGVIYNNGLTSIQTYGTLTFSVAFASISYASSMQYVSCSISAVTGSVTGTRYSIGANAVLYTAGGGANYFPGTVAGVTGGGGYYG